MDFAHMIVKYSPVFVMFATLIAGCLLGCIAVDFAVMLPVEV